MGDFPGEITRDRTRYVMDIERDIYPPVIVTVCYGKFHFCFMGRLTISMAIVNSYVKLPEGSFQSSRSYLDIIRRLKTHCWCLSHILNSKLLNY